MARGVKGTGKYSKYKPTPPPIEDTTTTAITAPAPAPTTTTKTKRKRTIDELDHVNPDKMTHAEAVAYIHSARASLRMQSNKINELTETCEKAFTQCRNLERAYDELKARANAKCNFIEQATTVFAKTISQTIAGGNV
jgi:hypothetical protein